MTQHYLLYQILCFDTCTYGIDDSGLVNARGGTPIVSVL